MQIKVMNYMASTSPLVQGFADVELNGWLRLNGLNLLRNHTLKSSQLTAFRNGKREYLSAVVVVDPDLRTLLETEILSAITGYLATLPESQRMRPPREQRERPVQTKPAEPVPPVAQVQAKPVPERPKPTNANKSLIRSLPLLAGRR